ncbi:MULTISPECIES: alpha/beta hydrolase [unclassified Hyphomonas]|uniref:alpha/beta fold hydrolase n=1 Tax=unclassified Hyphomonas TaxID=2630699 RepID=UPI000C4AD1F8|nr:MULTISPECIES: alpha/beta hydrolase [unclassified Hyphomonas]MAA82888.1 alpha/beta hydrolase [Hyphomonas sp.]MAN90925.1 alpha/beta hydrolase [Hyphomonadaceae bacterium]RCL87940.1 MAG: alpha/beta hydrolase [Hyphomonas sp.]HCN92417.1 alpha/beta hydrolase [Hyphomonas sp.]|tara:strand:- start:15460 stop:16290 length:831 start_codon:yes stop_codon:yes gene_type:complete
MPYIMTRDETEIFYRDWGPVEAPPIMFHHGWPLTADDWDNQMLFFLSEGYRVIAADRRGHGRSQETWTGNDMDTYAADTDDLVTALNLTNVVHVGHSTGGGVVARYVSQHGGDRAAKAVLIGAVPPLMLKTADNPDGIPMDVFDDFRRQLSDNRASFFLDVPSGPFFGFNRDHVETVEAMVHNWWRQGMMGSAKAHYDCIAAFSETDFTEDLKALKVPTLIMHGDDDQIVPLDLTARKAADLVEGSVLKIYEGLPHGLCTTHPELINPDLLDFIRA